jgi:ABC-type transport system involved in cytochrome c biogenesis permease component
MNFGMRFKKNTFSGCFEKSMFTNLKLKNVILNKVALMCHFSLVGEY